VSKTLTKSQKPETGACMWCSKRRESLNEWQDAGAGVLVSES
jgi:hypothetical protein